jgi:soluble P-type ATPase
LIQIEVPGWSTCELQHLVLDLNGTVALDGEPIAGVDDRVAALSAYLAVHLETADTHGQAEETGQQLGGQLVRVAPRYEASQKRALVERLGAAQVVAVGNRTNDARRLAAAALGIAILGREGWAIETSRADLALSCTEDALDLLLRPQRLIVTLRC